MKAEVFLAYYVAAWAIVTAIASKYYRGNARGLSIAPLIVVWRVPLAFTFLDRLKGSRLLNLLLDSGIAIILASMLFFYSYFISSLITYLSGKGATAALTPIVPGVTIGVKTFLYMLPGLSLAIIAHELSHALAARHEGVRIRSSGIMVIAGLLPAAFVEPGEEEIRKLRLRSRLRIYSAGVLANILAFLAIKLLLALLASNGFSTVIVDVEKGSIADRSGIKPGMLIDYFEVNGTRLNTMNDLIHYLNELRAKNNGTIAHLELLMVFVSKGGNVSIIKPAAPQDSSDTKYYDRIGIYMYPVSKILVKFFEPKTAIAITAILLYAALINISLALINSAPLFITDGARVVEDILKIKVKGRVSTVITYIVSAATLAIILPSLRL
ncbi:MAG: hypothetical protein DSY37_02045 [Hyperthermus sp.]|nr:MAG: hypothetical protein DSY37_02045 [Hyperthermus sp.]